MRVRIEAHIKCPEYAYYPGQLIIDHPDEREWLTKGWAVPADPPIETAMIEPPEAAVIRKPRRK